MTAMRIIVPNPINMNDSFEDGAAKYCELGIARPGGGLRGG